MRTLCLLSVVCAVLHCSGLIVTGDDLCLFVDCVLLSGRSAEGERSKKRHLFFVPAGAGTRVVVAVVKICFLLDSMMRFLARDDLCGCARVFVCRVCVCVLFNNLGQELWQNV